MIAIFYDTKNKCEVNSKQLMRINFVTDLLSTDSDDHSSTIGYHRMQLGNIGWRTKECPSCQNWDKWTLEENLVFLRLEDEPEELQDATNKRRPKNIKKLQKGLRKRQGRKRVLCLAKQAKEKRKVSKQVPQKEDWEITRDNCS